mmetsp:Transcript_17361/g.32916  ORF Transcript_17361/g.32916 Transcript_17361/m.32916 type:complete len:96 (-) Transcript_17361:104-391(-)
MSLVIMSSIMDSSWIVGSRWFPWILDCPVGLCSKLPLSMARRVDVVKDDGDSDDDNVDARGEQCLYILNASVSDKAANRKNRKLWSFILLRSRIE